MNNRNLVHVAALFPATAMGVLMGTVFAFCYDAHLQLRDSKQENGTIENGIKNTISVTEKFRNNMYTDTVKTINYPIPTF